MLKARFVRNALAVALFCSASALAQAPAGSTGLCNDGTYTSNATKSGACGGHKGIKTWYGPTGPTATPRPTGVCNDGTTTTAESKSGACRGHGGLKSWGTGASPAVAANSTQPWPPPKLASSTPTTTSPGQCTTSSTAAAGGGPALVWVNTPTKVYHCPTDRYYGKTKEGCYMTEAAAQAAGDKPDAGKKCF